MGITKPVAITLGSFAALDFMLAGAAADTRRPHEERDVQRLMLSGLGNAALAGGLLWKHPASVGLSLAGLGATLVGNGGSMGYGPLADPA